MKIILTVAFVILLVALAAYLVFFESGIIDFSSQKTPKPAEKTEFEPKDVKALQTREEIYRLAAKKDKADIPKFLARLKDDDAMVRLAAARAILQIGGKEYLPDITPLFKDPDTSVRAAVIQLVGDLREPSIVPALTEVLKTDKELSVRLVTVDALRKIQDESCIFPLIESLLDESIAIRTTASEALKAITFQKFDFDPQVLKDNPDQVYAKWNNWWEDEQVKKHFSLVGVKELETHGDASSVRILIRIARSDKSGTESQAVKSAAVSSLCRTNSSEALI